MEVSKALLMISFEIFLMYRDRPDLVVDQINALKNLIVPDNIKLELIFSDNSKSQNTVDVPSLFQVRYRGNISVQDHLNTCIAETKNDYFMLVHDDDVIMPDLFQKIQVYLSNPTYSEHVIAGVANIFRNQEPAFSGQFGLGKGVKIATVEEFLIGLFVTPGNKYPAFPVYIYPRSMKPVLFCDINKGGRFSDVSFLMDLYKLGRVLWIPDVYYLYRLHDSNDGHVRDIRSKISLFKHLFLFKYNLFTKLVVCSMYLKNILKAWIRDLING